MYHLEKVLNTVSFNFKNMPQTLEIDDSAPTSLSTLITSQWAHIFHNRLKTPRSNPTDHNNQITTICQMQEKWQNMVH